MGILKSLRSVFDYTPTDWHAGDVITALRLNNAEQGIDTNSNNIALLQQKDTSLDDDIAELRDDLTSRLYGGDFTDFEWVDGFIYADAVSTNAGWQRTTPAFMKQGEVLTFTGGKGDTAIPINAVSKYDNGNYSLVKSYSGTSSENISYTAPEDMYVVVSVKKDVYSNNLKIARTGDIQAIDNTLEKIPDYVYNDIEPKHLTISAGTSTAYHIDSGKEYLITNNGESGITLAFRVLPSSPTSVNVVYVGAKATASFTASGNADYIVCAANADFSISKNTALIPFIDNTMETLGDYGKKFALVDFTFSKDMFDFSSDLAGIDFLDVTGQGGWYTIQDVIYEKFDDLIEDYPGYVSKVDAGIDTDMTYPAYANLGGQASGNYSPTPTYKTYLYKLLTDDEDTVNGSMNRKKKILLIGATHGSETAGSFNLYLFAKNLCTCANEDYFKFRSAYDVYILPCLNGYGMYHYTRWNADGVNINRNYPIANFAVDGEPYDLDYTGPYAASEFETQMVIKLHEKYAFDVAIDHHNYGALANQFYTESWFERFRPLSNAALIDCSYAFIKNKSSYFGTNYKLFTDINNSTMPVAILSSTMPCMAKYFQEQEIDYAATIEISNTINYNAGVPSPSADNPKYTADVFAVGEFTLRNQLLHYCGFVIGGVGR